MALAKFHSLRGTKSALVMVRANKFVFSASPAYVPAAAVEGIEEGEEFEIPDGFTLTPWIDYETGEVRMTQPTDGSEPQQLMVLAY